MLRKYRGNSNRSRPSFLHYMVNIKIYICNFGFKINSYQTANWPISEVFDANSSEYRKLYQNIRSVFSSIAFLLMSWCLAGCETPGNNLRSIDSFAQGRIGPDIRALEKTVCIELTAENEFIVQLFKNQGWVTRPKVDATCQVAIMYNHNQPKEVMQPIYGLSYEVDGRDQTYSTGKCVFDSLVSRNGDAFYLLAYAIRQEQNSFENCTLRILLARRGHNGALLIPDKLIGETDPNSVEKKLSEALGLE
jgi:hypothetical protein